MKNNKQNFHIFSDVVLASIRFLENKYDGHDPTTTTELQVPDSGQTQTKNETGLNIILSAQPFPNLGNNVTVQLNSYKVLRT